MSQVLGSADAVHGVENAGRETLAVVEHVGGGADEGDGLVAIDSADGFLSDPFGCRAGPGGRLWCFAVGVAAGGAFIKIRLHGTGAESGDAEAVAIELGS